MNQRLDKVKPKNANYYAMKSINYASLNMFCGVQTKIHKKTSINDHNLIFFCVFLRQKFNIHFREIYVLSLSRLHSIRIDHLNNEIYVFTHINNLNLIDQQ